MKLINIGFGNIVNAGKIIAIVSPDSAPVKRMVQKAREEGNAIDATQGRRTKAVLVMENSQLVLSALLPEKDSVVSLFAKILFLMDGSTEPL